MNFLFFYLRGLKVLTGALPDEEGAELRGAAVSKDLCIG